jgi:hypothetical protein
MQVTALIAVTIVVVCIAALVLGLVWFVAIPVAILLMMIPIGYMITLLTQRKARMGTGESHGVPTSREASYNPVSDPSKPGTTPR